MIDEQKLKKLATSEQVENMRVGIVREMVGIQTELKQVKGLYEALNCQIINVSKKQTYRSLAYVIICIAIIIFSYELYIIINKLTALGL